MTMSLRNSENKSAIDIVIAEAAGYLLKAAGDFDRCGIKLAGHHWATDFFIFRKDGVGLRFSVEMVDLAERLEVGVLHVDEATDECQPDKKIALPVELTGDLGVERLVFKVGGKEIDSGLVITAKDGAEIIIVSGVFPCTVEVKMTPASGIARFEPEYEIERYERKPLF
jgi:hypothetical protein